VQIFSPGKPSKSPIDVLSCPAFTVATIQPVALLNENFLCSYIRRGSLYVMSTGLAVDRHNTLCITGGMLHLFVDSDTYRRLGIVGKASGVHQSGQFFHVQINLGAEGFHAGDSNYDRTYWCLKRMHQVRVLASHTLDGAATSTVDFAAELQTENRQARCHLSSHTLAPDVRMPSVPELSALVEAPGSDDVPSETFGDVLEWLGFVHGNMQGCIASGAPVDEFATCLQSPQLLASSLGTGHVQQLRGFLTPPTVNILLSSVVEQVRSGQLPWASLVVWGFQDAPLSWGTSAHCFADGIDQVYIMRTLVMTANPCKTLLSSAAVCTLKMTLALAF
jgi:ribonuclease P/MRP protein subunit RPP40